MKKREWNNGGLIVYKKGDIIGECVFINYPYKDITSGGRSATFLCKCGKEFIARVNNVKNKTTRSCGCLALATATKLKTIHGNYNIPEFKTWTAMFKRCYNPKEISYKNYGGRGIKICKRWSGKNGFNNFYQDMGKKPSPKHTIDRLDNNKNYCKANCKWSTMREQSFNRRNSVFITFNGRTQCLSEWAIEMNIPYATLASRISKNWTLEKALSPIKYTKHTKTNNPK